MSRIGKQPIVLEKGITASISGKTITLKGPKGEQSYGWKPEVEVTHEDGTIKVQRQGDSKNQRAMHGLTRTLIYNMAVGVSQGYSKSLDIIGVGFKAESKGDTVELTVGFTNPYPYKLPAGVSASVADKGTRLTVSGIDKQKVGQAAAEIRAVRPPEPYKGKGIKYVDEQIKRKVGKTTA
jgi:large subunit ribosomal protein L6